MHRLIVIGLVLLAAGLTLNPATSFAQSQQPQRRTLLEMLFGPRTPPPQAVPQPQRQAPVVRRRVPPKLPPAKPGLVKAEAATRIAVFGDSLAGDLGKGLERFYADNPDIAVLQQSVGSSGLVRQDYFNWNEAISKQIKADSFDLAVVMIGLNDRQNLRVDGTSVAPLTDAWNAAYSARLNQLLGELAAANKPVVWVGLPPMQSSSLTSGTSQITMLERLASYGNGVSFVDIYDHFLDANGNYASRGPDINGQQVLIRRSDGIHFTNAGADKLAFYVNKAIKLFYHGGSMSINVVDPLAGTDAGKMLRPPYQGVGQIRLLQVAGEVTSLTGTPPRAQALVEGAGQQSGTGFNLKQLIEAPKGRADAFGAGIDPAHDKLSAAGGK